MNLLSEVKICLSGLRMGVHTLEAEAGRSQVKSEKEQKAHLRSRAVPHICNPSYVGGGHGKTVVLGHLGQKT
jgi:hypothetical protein